jgi:hypothetical protein
MRVDARHLRSDVGAQPQHASGQLVDELERLQIEVVAGARQQGIDVLEQRRHHELVAVQAEEVEDVAAQPLDARGLARQDVLDVLRQQPGAHKLELQGQNRGIIEESETAYWRAT